jgi:hypothetical protein
MSDPFAQWEKEFHPSATLTPRERAEAAALAKAIRTSPVQATNLAIALHMRYNSDRWLLIVQAATLHSHTNAD